MPNTCDNAWGRTLVRAQRILPVSDSRYLSASFAGGTLTVFTELPSGVQVAAPAGTAIGVVSAPDGCDVTVTPSTVPNNVVFPTAHVVNATGTCGGSIVFDIGGRTTVTVN